MEINFEEDSLFIFVRVSELSVIKVFNELISSVKQGIGSLDILLSLDEAIL